MYANDSWLNCQQHLWSSIDQTPQVLVEHGPDALDSKCMASCKPQHSGVKLSYPFSYVLTSEYAARTRFVLRSRTPQLMSKPTPPGDTTASGSAMSNAATLPMANPYPECTSGRAMDFCTAAQARRPSVAVSERRDCHLETFHAAACTSSMIKSHVVIHAPWSDD